VTTPATLADDHDIAVRLFRLVEGRSDVDRRLVFDATRERLDGAVDLEHAEMLEAVRACGRDLGVTVPSAAKYESWRASRGLGAPTVAQFRSRFGSWRKALAALLGGPEADPTRRRLLPSNPKFTEEAVRSALRAFLASLAPGEPPTRWSYAQWASRQARNADGTSAVPRSAYPFLRLFGSWDAALAAEGVQPPLPRQHACRVAASRNSAAIALRRAHRALGDPMTFAMFNAWAAEDRRRYAAGIDPEIPPAPSATSVRRLFGGWHAAVRKVLGDGVLLSARGRPRSWGLSQLEAGYRTCAKHYSHAPSFGEYDRYRQAHMTSDGSFSLPHAHTLSHHIGGGTWSGVARRLGAPLARLRRPSRFSYKEARAAVLACHEELGRVPCQREYSAWRIRGEAEGSIALPSVETIRKRFAGARWSRIAELLGLDVPRSCRKGAAYTEEDAIDAWSACRADLGRPPTKRDYSAWRARRMHEAGIDLPNYATLMHHLGGGSWAAIAERFGVEVPSSRGRKRRFSDEQLRAAFTACRRELGWHPTVTAYESWRRACLCRGEQPPPAATTLIRRLGSGAWHGGKLADADGHPFDRFHWRLSDQALAGAWRACAADLGHAPPRFDYDVWRRGEIDRGRTRPPWAGTIALRLGGRSWAAAARHAASADKAQWPPRRASTERQERRRRASRSRLSVAVAGQITSARNASSALPAPLALERHKRVIEEWDSGRKSQTAIARELGISQGTVSLVLKRNGRSVGQGFRSDLHRRAA
jgi:hypothetical protein